MLGEATFQHVVRDLGITPFRVLGEAIFGSWCVFQHVVRDLGISPLRVLGEAIFGSWCVI